MLINLSSNGETNHANFINRFADNIVIKPNSKICLTRVSLVRSSEQTKIIIPAGTTISFRFTPYDVSEKIINIAETTYSADELTNRFNTLYGGLVAYNYEFKARVEIVNNDVEIEFTSYLAFNKWVGTFVRGFIFGDLDARNMSYKEILLTDGSTVPTGTIDAANELRGVLWTGGAGQKAFNPYWGFGNYKIDAQTNGGCYNLFCFGDLAAGTSNVTAVNPTLTTPQVLRIGYSEFDNAADKYSLAPVPGSTSKDNYFYEVKFGETGTANNRSGQVVVTMFNNETEAHEEVGNVRDWYCGDMAVFTVENVANPSGNEGSQQIFTFSTTLQGRKGLIGYLPSQLTGTKYWNVEAPVYMTQAEYWDNFGNDPTNLATHFDGAKIYGTRFGRGIKPTQIQQLPIQYKMQASVGTTTPMLYSAVPTGTRGLGNYPFYETYNAGAGGNDNGNLCCYTLLDANGIPSGVVPTFISFVFQLVDKTGHTGQTQRTLFSGSVNSGMRMDFGAVSGWDIEFFEIDTTQHTHVLLDGATNPIVWNYTSNYLFQMKTYGYGINSRYDIRVVDMVTSTEYTATGTMTGGGLEPTVTLAGDPASSNNEYYLHGYLGEFRYYQKPATDSADITYWDELADNLKLYYNGIGGGNTILDAFGATNYHDLYRLGEAKYCNYGVLDPALPMCPTLGRFGDGAAYDANWYNMTDLWFFPSPTMPIAERKMDSTNSYAYDNQGQGIVNSNDLDDILDLKDYNSTEQRVLKFQKTALGQEDADNPIFSTTSEVEAIEIEDKIFNVQIKNLPHRNYNGAISNFDKTIYQIGSMVHAETVGDKKIIEIYPPTKVFSSLENAGDIILNQLEVMITDELNIEETDLKANTNVTIEIL